MLPAEDANPSPARFVSLALVLEGGLAAVAMVIGWLVGFDPWHGLWRTDYDASALCRDVLWGVAATGPAVAILLVDFEQWRHSLI
ncbi:hypothetical protein [Anatilimnocola floriformis]|uniref:hypothetical protein n=1 Tax=Anatilimnocola floriformis TaxID=2948575 RepID=UPI0020C53AAD|nr:hypothetical protein [Anatilimnocola floriformis]